MTSYAPEIVPSLIATVVAFEILGARMAGDEAFDDLLDLLSERSAAAARALKARREDLTAFHNLNVPSTLNVTFLSTNCMENSFRNWREATGNVKR